MVDYYSCKMSGSDEEFEPQIQTGMSKAELRRSNKPIMEKKRRARINQCLDELKSLILEAMKKDPTRHSKLEKADILEMTVKHLQQIQRQQLSTAVATDPAVLTKFRSGFSECANEVSRYVNHLENVDPTVKQRLVSHLNNCVSNIQQVSPFYNHYVPYMPERLYPEVKVGFQSDVQTSGGDENNNNNNNNGPNNAQARIQIPSNVQLIPSRLPTGELALLVPPSAGISANFPFFPPTAGSDSGSRTGTPSAFTAVQRTHSPLLSPSTSTSSYEENHHSEHYQASLSPPPQMRFKMPEQSPASSVISSRSSYSSPETQKPQISSSSDRNSPIATTTAMTTMTTMTTTTPPTMHFGEISKRDSADFSADGVCTYAANLRQPLSVITDKYNRPLAIPKREPNGLKRHNSDGLLTVAEKKPRYSHHEPLVASTSSPSSSSSSSSSSPPANIRIKEEFPNSSDEARTATTTTSHPVVSSETPTTPNGDMWRPW